MKPYVTIRALRSWTAHNAEFTAGKSYRVRDFLAAVLVAKGYAEIVAREAQELVGQGDLW